MKKLKFGDVVNLPKPLQIYHSHTMVLAVSLLAGPHSPQVAIPFAWDALPPDFHRTKGFYC
jgi:hypothetical protein